MVAADAGTRNTGGGGNMCVSVFGGFVLRAFIFPETGLKVISGDRRGGDLKRGKYEKSSRRMDENWTRETEECQERK